MSSMKSMRVGSEKYKTMSATTNALINPLSRRFKSQSAMEYLMTYGWAILIIAVVLIALFQLGVFNGSSLAPKAQPGSCEVVKSSAGASLAGTCNNDLPQYVAQFNGASTGCGGSPDYVPLSVTMNPSITSSAVTITYWVYLTSSTAPWSVQITAPNQNIYCQLANNNGCYVYGYYPLFPSSFKNNEWYFVALSLSGTTATAYQNAIPGAPVSYSGSLSGNTIDMLGYSPGCADLSPGSMADVQVYNTSLSQSDITSLYQEGIGGAPQNIQYLVGWWPLNGNANDYSGNNNDGTATNVIYTGSWTSGYSTP